MGIPESRYTVFDDVRRKKYLDALKEGMTYVGAAGVAGVTARTARNHRHRSEDFEAQEAEAYEAGAARIEKAIRKRALDPKNASDTMLIWLSKNRMGWHDRQHIEHAGGVTVNIDGAGLGMSDEG